MAGLTERERELVTERAKIWDGMCALIAKREDGEHITPEDRAAYEARETDLQAVEAELRIVKSHQEREAAARETPDTGPDTRGAEGTPDAKVAEERADAAFRAYLRYGEPGVQRLDAEHRGALVPQGEPAEAAGREVRLSPLSTAPGAPAAGSTLAGEGGYLVPQGFWHNLQIALKQYGGTANHFRMVRTATGNPMPWPTMDPTGIIGSLLSENTQVTEVDFNFGQGMLSAWTYTSGLHLASIQIVNDSAFDVDGFVRDRVGEAIGRAIAAAAQSGSGSSQPLGVSTALAARGVVAGASGGIYKSGTSLNSAATAGGNVSTFQTPAGSAKLAAGLMGFDDVQGMIAKVDPAYRTDAWWYLTDTTMAGLRQVTSTTGFPLWQPNVQVGGNEPDRISGFPVQIDNNVSLISTSASTVGGPIFGSMSHAMVYRLVDQAGVLRLTERYADFLQVGYIGYVRLDIRSNDLRAAVQYSTNAT